MLSNRPISEEHHEEVAFSSTIMDEVVFSRARASGRESTPSTVGTTNAVASTPIDTMCMLVVWRTEYKSCRKPAGVSFKVAGGSHAPGVSVGAASAAVEVKKFVDTVVGVQNRRKM